MFNSNSFTLKVWPVGEVSVLLGKETGTIPVKQAAERLINILVTIGEQEFSTKNMARIRTIFSLDVAKAIFDLRKELEKCL